MASPVGALTVVDLLDQFGPIPASRIRHDPAPGTATEQDVIDIEARENRLCELVDGILVEKTVGYYESCLAVQLIRFLGNFADEHDLGVVAGEAGMLRLAPGLVRIPDVSFISWNRLPGRRIPREPIPDLAPDLAVEVLSQSNTPQEMDRKLRDYFAAGASLVWYVDPQSRTVRVHTAPDQSKLLGEEATLRGGDLLPGFELPLCRLFAEAKS